MPVITSGGSAVGSSQIINGSIVNEDINANAAIEVSKLLNPAFKTLADVTLSGAGTSLNSGTFVAHTHLKVKFFIVSMSVAGRPSVRFNGDSGLNYNYVSSDSGGAGSVASNQAQISLDANDDTTGRYYEMDLYNVAAYQKHLTLRGGRLGSLMEMYGYWNNTSDQITSIVLTATQNMAIGSRIVVLGMN